jgi:hypothetical protein
MKNEDRRVMLKPCYWQSKKGKPAFLINLGNISGVSKMERKGGGQTFNFLRFYLDRERYLETEYDNEQDREIEFNFIRQLLDL